MALSASWLSIGVITLLVAAAPTTVPQTDAKAAVSVWPGTTVRVATTGSHYDPIYGADAPAVSADGRVVAFSSAASDLVAGDTNDATDVFVQNVATGVTHLVSIRSNGGQGSRASLDSALSSNGRYVAFTSYAGDLVRGDANHSTDIFVHDRRSGKTNRVSVRSDGKEVRGDSMFASISGDGERVAFVSWATQLVRHDTNDFADVFVHNLLTGTTRLASMSTDGEQGSSYSLHPSISSDGRFVAFYTASSNLTSRPTDGHTNVYVRNIDQGTTHLVSLGNHEQIGVKEGLAPFISADGRFVLFNSNSRNLVKGDTNGAYDVFVRDRKKKTTLRVSVQAAGVEGNDNSFGGGISADGRRILFESQASNWLIGDAPDTGDAFLRSTRTETTHWINVGLNDEIANAPSFIGGISHDGTKVVFGSEASNLVSGDTNGLADIFIRIRSR